MTEEDNFSGSPDDESSGPGDGDDIGRDEEDRQDSAQDRIDELESTIDTLRGEIRVLQTEAGDISHPVKALRALLKGEDAREILQEAASRAAEGSVKASFDHRLDRIRDEVKKGLEVASNDLFARVKGSLEGKVLVAVNEATTSKEFRGILREITQNAAKEALKEAGQPLLEKIRMEAEASMEEGWMVALKNMDQDLEPKLKRAFQAFAETEAFRDTLETTARPLIEEIGSAPSTSGGIDPDQVDAMLESAVREMEESVRKRIEGLSERLQAVEEGAGGAGGEAEGDMIRMELETMSRRLEALETRPEAPEGGGEAAAEAAREEAQAAVSDLAARVEALEARPAGAEEGEGGGRLSEDQVKAIIRKSMAEALSGVKAMAQKIPPAINQAVEAALRKKLADVPSREEVKALAAQAGGEGEAPAIDAEALRRDVMEGMDAEVSERVQEAIRRALAPGSDQGQDFLKQMMGQDTLENLVQEILESDLFTSFLNSDEMKELLDDKFKIMRNWLKNEEIPKQVKKLGGA